MRPQPGSSTTSIPARAAADGSGRAASDARGQQALDALRGPAADIGADLADALDANVRRRQLRALRGGASLEDAASENTLPVGCVHPAFPVPAPPAPTSGTWKIRSATLILATVTSDATARVEWNVVLRNVAGGPDVATSLWRPRDVRVQRGWTLIGDIREGRFYDRKEAAA